MMECQDCYGCGTTNCGCPHHDEKELGCDCCNADGNCKECGDAQKKELG